MSRYKRLSINELIVDERYQRPLDMRRVDRIVKNFDLELFGVLEVSERDGTYAVFDGQHRLVAARKLGFGKVPCLVHSGMKPGHEASLFIALQQGRKGINPVEKFNARVFAGDSQAQVIAQIVADSGFTIAHRASAGEQGVIRAISAVEWIYKNYGEEHLSATLSLAHDLWFGDPRSTDGYLLQGLAQFYDSYYSRIGDGEIERLRAASPTVIVRRALGPMQGGGAHARHAIDRELRKVAGVRGRPAARKVSDAAFPASIQGGN